MNIEDLKTNIINANEEYRKGTPIMSDQEFDDLCDQLHNLIPESEYSSFRDTLNEGSIEIGEKVQHKFIAGSLDKLKYEEPETIRSFIKKNVKNKLNVSAKIDGLTGICHYNNGKLIGFATRGDGYKGINITDKSKYIKGIPQEISLKDDIYIRGELVILKDDYNKIEGTSPRNIVAGLINRKEYDPNEMGNISFVSYTIMGPKYCKVHQFEELNNLGFITAWYENFDLEEYNSENFVEELFRIASMDFKYQTDGLVLSDTEYINEDKYRPDCQVAFKTNQQKFQTRLIDVEWQGPSKDGRHNILGILEPVDCGGVLVSKCTLHNLDFIKEHNLKIGDIVSICRSGDVIPKMLGVVETSENSVDIEIPRICNCCGSELIQEGPFLYCKNPDCGDKTTYQVMHFIKKCGVEYASFKTLQNFGIRTFKDLLEYKGRKSYKSEMKLEKELYDKVFTLSKKDIFCKLNMKDVGETLLCKIVEFYGFDKIENCSIESEPLSILPDGIGDITMNKFLDDYKTNLKIANDIVSDSRYHYVLTEGKIAKNSEILGSVCFTGSLNTMSRSQASKLAEEHGYQVKSSVSKGLTYLVTNDKNSGSSKNKKAQQFGTKIINEDEFLDLVKDNLINIDDL